jgi:hypothetical protein
MFGLIFERTVALLARTLPVPHAVMFAAIEAFASHVPSGLLTSADLAVALARFFARNDCSAATAESVLADHGEELARRAAAYVNDWAGQLNNKAHERCRTDDDVTRDARAVELYQRARALLEDLPEMLRRAAAHPLHTLRYVVLDEALNLAETELSGS